MYATIKINNTTIFEDIQGALVHEIAEYVEIVRGTELGFETVELNAKGFAKFLASRHIAIVENETETFAETDSLYYETERVLVSQETESPFTLIENFNRAETLFGVNINEIKTLTVEIN